MTLSSEVVSEGTERAPLSQPSVLSPVPGAYRSEGWETLPELSPDPPAASGPDGSAATRSAAVEQLGRGLPRSPSVPDRRAKASEELPWPLQARIGALRPKTRKPVLWPLIMDILKECGWATASELALLLAMDSRNLTDAT